MIYGFTGAHRTGKTTLAKEVAKIMKIEFWETNSGLVLKEAGFDLVAPMDIDRRLLAQNILLDYHIKMIEKLPRPLIVDRTPIDMAAYTLAEMTMTNCTSDQGKAMTEYLDKCIQTTNFHYDSMIVVRPLPIYVSEEGKPSFNPGFQTKIQYLIEGILEKDFRNSTGKLLTTDHQIRVKSSIAFINDRIERFSKSVKNETFN